MSLLPTAKRPRDRLLTDSGIEEWYAKAGYSIEPNEYQVIPEGKGTTISDIGTSSPVKTVPLPEDYELEDPNWQPVVREDLPEDAQEDLSMDIAIEAGLSPREYDTVWWVLEGNRVLGTDYLASMAEALALPRTAVEKSWASARKKLRASWALAPDRHQRPVGHAELSGAGLYPLGGYDNPLTVLGRGRRDLWPAFRKVAPIDIGG